MESDRTVTGLAALVLILAFGSGAVRAEDWTDQRVAGRFYLHADFPLQGHEQLVANLDTLQQELAELFGLATNQQPIHIFLFETRSAYEGYLRQYFPAAPTRRALFIKGHGPGMVFAYLNPEFEVDVRHEATHALLHSALPLVPLWLDEGLAEYFEVVPDQRVTGNPHLTPSWWAAMFYRTRKLESLEQLQDVSQMGQSEYRAAWAWVHFLLHGPPPARQQLIALFADLQADRVPETLSVRLRRVFPDLDVQLRAHLRAAGRTR